MSAPPRPLQGGTPLQAARLPFLTSPARTVNAPDPAPPTGRDTADAAEAHRVGQIPARGEAASPSSPVSTEEILKSLMAGFIYPAVLGSIIYLGLDTIAEQVSLSWAFQFGASSQVAFEPRMLLKLGLYVVITAFYFCDYLYLTFTNDFTRWFFVADLVFVVFLYTSVYAVRLTHAKAMAPDMGLIAICFAIFMVMYGVWDWYERRRALEDERAFYNGVLTWEAILVRRIRVLRGRVGGAGAGRSGRPRSVGVTDADVRVLGRVHDLVCLDGLQRSAGSTVAPRPPSPGPRSLPADDGRAGGSAHRPALP